MEPGGGNSYSGDQREAEAWRPSGEGKAPTSPFFFSSGGEGGAGAAAAPIAAAPLYWRKSRSESAPPRGLGRRSLTAIAQSSNLKFLLERDLSKERHELLKDQRLFRNQARKHSIETNKRRRALEEKWKEDAEREQKIREQILLQRKLKHQEATERFQRGHLSSSQRKKGGGVQRQTEPKLDEALQKIQPGLLPSRVIERTADMPSSATRNDPLNWKQNSEKTGGDRITQENRRANMNSDQVLFQKNLDEMQQQLQEQHFSNLQDFHQEVNEITRSESVCSVDSLEAGEPNENCATPSETSSLSAQLESSVHNSQGPQTGYKCFPDKTDIALSKNQHVNNWLINLNTSDIQTTSPFRDILIKRDIVPSDKDACNPDGKSSVPNVSEQKVAERCASDDNLTFAQNKREGKSFLLKRPSSGRVSTESPSATETPVLKLNKAWTIPDPSPDVSVQEKNSELPQNNRALPAQASNQHAVSTFPVFPATDQNTKSPHDSFLLNYMEKGKDVHAARCTEDTDSLTGAKDEKDMEHVSLEGTFEETSKSSSGQQKNNGEGGVEEKVLSLPQGNLSANSSDLDQQKNDKVSERKGVKFPKSILKKESKYEAGYFKAMVVNKGIKFGNQAVSAARDSIELAKIKGKDADIQKNSKKLRWFDEIHRVVEANDDEKCSEQSITEIPQPQTQSPSFHIKAAASRTNLRSIPSYMFNSIFLENHHVTSQTSAKPHAVGGLDRDNVIQNKFLSGGYHVARQAWMAPRGEEIISLLHNYDPKNQKNIPRKGRTKMIKRPKSAKAQSSTSVIKNRKGTIIRPQSANEATKVMKTQGKIIMPHPPCKPILGKRPDENPTDGVYQSVNLCKPQPDTENSHFLSGKSPLPEGQDVGRDTTEQTLPLTNACHSRAAIMRPSYSVFTYESLTKGKCIPNTARSIARSNSFPKKNPVCSENGLCLDRTPTDEEIAILWKGVHRALAQKDGVAGESQNCATLCNNSNNGDVQPTRPNVSHITIDGSTLISNSKTIFRPNTIVVSQPSVSVAFARRKHIYENIENKRKALLEQRRQIAAFAGRPATAVGQNTAQVMKRVQSAHEPVQSMGSISHSDEVSDSTAQFLLAENLVNLSAKESEILTGLDGAQPHKQTVVLNRPPRQGMSALSFEEHKVLQSLDRINQRLQNRISLVHGPYTSYAKV